MIRRGVDKWMRDAGKVDARLRAELAAEVEAKGLQLADWEPADVALIRADAPRKWQLPAGVDALTGRECMRVLAEIRGRAESPGAT